MSIKVIELFELLIEHRPIYLGEAQFESCGVFAKRSRLTRVPQPSANWDAVFTLDRLRLDMSDMGIQDLLLNLNTESDSDDIKYKMLISLIQNKKLNMRNKKANKKLLDSCLGCIDSSPSDKY